MVSVENQDVHQLAKLMNSVVEKRKTYPKKIMELENERINAMIKHFEEAEVELDESDSQEFKMQSDSVKDSLAQIPKVHSSSLIEEKYQKAVKKSVEIHQFLNFVRTCNK